jgi:type I restriction enzyme S subunit
MAVNTAWAQCVFGDVTKESKERLGAGRQAPRVFGVDRHVGLTHETKYSAADVSKYKVIKPGMFAYNPMRLNIGSIAYCGECDGTGVVSPDYVVFGCCDDRLDHGFLKYFITGSAWRDWTTAAGVGSVRVRIYFRELALMPLRLPPLSEQKRIAHILGTLDDTIELSHRMNATLESIAQAIFKSWFVDFDPVRQKAAVKQPVGMNAETASLFPDSFEDSEIGPIPQGWHVRTLKELTAKIGSGSTPRGGSEVYVDQGPAIIRSQNIYDHEFCWAGLARLSDKSATELKNAEVLTDDVLMNITGDSILRTCVVDPAALPARVNQHVAIIRAIKGIPPRYLHLYLVRDSMKSFLLGLSAGATRHAITKGHLESIAVLKPCDPVLAAFERLTSPWFTLIDNSRSQSRTLAALRDTLLPKLLSGDVRVPEAEGMVEEATT